MSGLRPLAILAAALLLLGLAPGAASAQSEPERTASRLHFLRAEALFKDGNYADALTQYEIGYDRLPLPGFLINIAQCHRMLGDLRKARAHYRKFLLVQPTSNRRAEIEALIADLDKGILQQEGASQAESARRAPVAAPSPRPWLWSALASTFVGSTVATHVLDGASAHDTRSARR